MGRGNGGQDIFSDAADRKAFLAVLRRAKRDTPFILHAYCEMTNHFHFLVEVAEFPLSTIMQRLLTRYACYFNARVDRRGHLFQGRFKAIRCSGDAYVMQVVRYIHLNPVAAGLVSRPMGWEWSSHSAYLGHEDGLTNPEFVLSLFDEDVVKARARYKDFLLACTDFELPEPPELPPMVKPYHGPTPAQQRESLPLIARDEAMRSAVAVSDLIGTRRDRTTSCVRRRFIQRAARSGFGGSEIARYLGRLPSFVSRVLAEESEK